MKASFRRTGRHIHRSREQEGQFCALEGLSRSPREQEGLFWRTGWPVEVAS
uniref:hypothetical protein n=1 Tax=Candidatus Cryptobacteroides bacterium TaxID=3085639 RepID=UPI004027FDF6